MVIVILPGDPCPPDGPREDKKLQLATFQTKWIILHNVYCWTIIGTQRVENHTTADDVVLAAGHAKRKLTTALFHKTRAANIWRAIEGKKSERTYVTDCDYYCFAFSYVAWSVHWGCIWGYVLLLKMHHPPAWRGTQAGGDAVLQGLWRKRVLWESSMRSLVFREERNKKTIRCSCWWEAKCCQHFFCIVFWR